MRTRTDRSLWVLVLVPALVLAACGGGDDDDGDDGSASSAEETTSSTAEGVDDATVDLATTVWFAGFAVDVEEASVATDELGAAVTITARAENLGGDSISAPSEVALVDEAAGAQFNPDLARSEIPEVPGTGTGDVTYVFPVPDGFVLDDAVLTFGAASLAQATIPLDGETDPVTLEPVEVDLAGSFDAGLLSFALHEGEVRYDRPDNHTAAEAGKAFLHVTYDVTYTGTFAGGYPFATDETRLETASGTSLAPVEFPIELLRAQSSITDVVAIWEIDTDDPGEWQFVGVYLPGDPEEARGRLAFEMPELLAE